MPLAQNLSKQEQVNSWFQQGLAFYRQERFKEAQNFFESVLAIQENHLDALRLLGISRLWTGHFLEATVLFISALKINPQHAATYCNLGYAFGQLGCFNEALTYFDKAILLKPDYAEVYSNRGNTLLELGRLNEALSDYDKAILLKPDYANAYSNRGNTLLELGRLNEALSDYDKAILLKPDYAEAHWNLSLCHLLNGNLRDGWLGYEWRWKSGDLLSHTKHQNRPEPLWLGAESLQDKTIFIYAEQGLGDTIQFCRYIPLLAQLGAKVILEVQPPLLDLLKNLEGVSQIIAQGDALPSFDYRCPLMSLPLAFQTELHTIPQIPKHIGGNKEGVMKWQTKLGEKKKPRIGIVWSSVSSYKKDQIRSITLSQLLTALPKEGFEYICLQKEMKEIDKVTLQESPHIQFFGDQLSNFSDTACLIECLDLVISTCTSVPHLSCSLGKETWLMLSHVSDYRWLLDRDDSPWYPSARLFRQERYGDWDGVMGRVKAELEKRR
jgi:tetratricopeptide (TPR) repeat protein